MSTLIRKIYDMTILFFSQFVHNVEWHPMGQSEALINNVDENKSCEAAGIIVHTVGGLHGKISCNESSTLVMLIKWLLNFVGFLKRFHTSAMKKKSKCNNLLCVK